MNPNTDPSSRTVARFCLLPPEGLLRLRDELGLALGEQELLLCRDRIFRPLRRDPTVWELRFLDGLITDCHTLPDALTVAELRTEDNTFLRAWQDAARMQAQLGKNGMPTLRALSSLCGAYLSRAGIAPYDTALLCGTRTELGAFALDGDAPLLDLEGTVATYAKSRPVRYTDARMLLALRATESTPLSDLVRALFAQHDAHLFPLGVYHSSHLLPRLLALEGLCLDLDKLPTGTKPAFVFLAPEAVLPALFATGAPLSLLGYTDRSGHILLREGAITRSALPLTPLRTFLTARRALCVQLPAHAATESLSPRVAATAHKLLGGIRIRAHAEQGLLALLCALCEQGADLSRATLHTVIELPANAVESAVPEVLLPLLELHRVQAELALPSRGAHTLQTDCGAPALTLFVSAPRAQKPSTAFCNAAMQRDFAAMRRVLTENF